MNDKDSESLLPWYVNGSLTQEEGQQVASFLEQSAEGRAQRAVLEAVKREVQADLARAQAEPVDELNWRRLQQQINQELPREIPAKQSSRVKPGQLWKPLLGLAAMLALVVQVAIFARMDSHEDSIRLLSAQPGADSLAAAWVLQVEIAPEASWSEVVKMLRTSQAAFVGSPSEFGLIRLRVPLDNARFSSAQEALAYFQSQDFVLHGELELEQAGQGEE